jgi:integrase/recombinase XerD
MTEKSPMLQGAEALLQSLEEFLTAFWLERGLSDNTLAAYRRDLEAFVRWWLAQSPQAVAPTQADVEAYLAARQAEGLSAASRARALSALRAWSAYLCRQGYWLVDPMEFLSAPRLPQRLPKGLGEKQVEQLLAAPDIADPLGLRDRAMLEMLYAAGLRVSELIHLRLMDINLRQGVVRLRGKGGKERLVPLGDECVFWLNEYLSKARDGFAGGVTDWVFLSQRNQCMTRQAFWYRIKHWAGVAGIDSALSPHTLRHAFATHLLNHGADIRSLQMLLGHSDLSSTQIYTQVAKARLKQLHQAHHPRG